MRQRIAKRLPDADKLVGLSLALRLGSRIEDRFWEAKLDALLSKIVRNGNQTTLDAALDHLQQNHPDAYGALADMAETHSESMVIEHDGQPFDALLVAVPVLAWTRYMIPSGLLKGDVADALRTHLQAHVLRTVPSSGLPVPLQHRPVAATPRRDLPARPAARAWGDQPAHAQAQLRRPAETSPILADPRFLLAVVAAPPAHRCSAGRKKKTAAGSNAASASSNGRPKAARTCRSRCPAANSNACFRTRTTRPAGMRTNGYVHIRSERPFVIYSTRGAAPQELRAVVAGFGERRIDEYRVGFTRRASNDVIYGVVWPLYGRENGDMSIDSATLEGEAPIEGPVEEIVSLLKECGVTDVRRHAAASNPNIAMTAACRSTQIRSVKSSTQKCRKTRPRPAALPLIRSTAGPTARHLKPLTVPAGAAFTCLSSRRPKFHTFPKPFSQADIV